MKVPTSQFPFKVSMTISDLRSASQIGQAESCWAGASLWRSLSEWRRLCGWNQIMYPRILCAHTYIRRWDGSLLRTISRRLSTGNTFDFETLGWRPTANTSCCKSWEKLFLGIFIPILIHSIPYYSNAYQNNYIRPHFTIYIDFSVCSHFILFLSLHWPRKPSPDTRMINYGILLTSIVIPRDDCVFVSIHPLHNTPPVLHTLHINAVVLLCNYVHMFRYWNIV